MAYKHGVYISEVPTSILPPVEATAGLPVFVGRAPVNLASDPTAYVNKPILAYTYAEAVAALGYSDDFSNYELCEAMSAMFSLFSVAPVVLINVLDPAVHKTSTANQTVTITDDEVLLAPLGVLLNSLVVKKTEAGQPLVKNTDYTAAFNDDGKVLITVLEGGAITTETSLVVSYDKINPAAVDAEDIIGGVNVSTGKLTGMELINQIFPLFRLVPGQLVSPGWSHDPVVAAVMKSKVQNINGLFKAMAVCDIDSTTADGADLYTEAPAWKNDNNYTDKLQIVCWPQVKLGNVKYRLSTQLAALMCRVDATNDDIPYVSPSNNNLQANAAVTSAGDVVSLDPQQAAYLNGQGIVTALNFIGGWKAWGNRTGIYPGGSDPKDSWIPVRRMFNWIGNSIILTYWQKVDNPTNRRLTQTVVDSLNIWLNGLTARETLLGGRVEFLASENPVTDLMNGIVRFHVYMTPPTPAEDMEFVLEFDTTYYSNLFSE